MLISHSVKDLDKADPLQHKKSEFILPNNTVYMDGNSLGPLTKSSKNRVAEVVSQQWGADLIHSWNAHHWIDLPLSVGDKIAPIIGAQKGQVIACDSTSVNLFKVLSCSLALNSSRQIILSQKENFPTDLYMAQGLSQLLGSERCKLVSVSEDKLVDKLDESVAVLMLTQVDFRSGRLHDMQELTKRAHDCGALVVWDLAHSAGALEVCLDNCDVDFAVGCGYKYLNGGPGAPAFIYAAFRHHASIVQPLSGWMGHRTPFAFEHDYQPSKGMLAFLTGTPNILSLAALDASLDVFSGVPFSDLRAKSSALSELFIKWIDDAPSLQQFSLISPRDAQQRGSHLAYSHPNAFAISQALIDHGIIVDFREPNIIRFGFTPLYLSYQDIWNAFQTLTEIVDTEIYLNQKYFERNRVT